MNEDEFVVKSSYSESCETILEEGLQNCFFPPSQIDSYDSQKFITKAAAGLSGAGLSGAGLSDAELEAAGQVAAEFDDVGIAASGISTAGYSRQAAAVPSSC